MWLANIDIVERETGKAALHKFTAPLDCTALITCEKILAAFSKKAVFLQCPQNHQNNPLEEVRVMTSLFLSSFKRVIQLYVQLSDNHACILA